jgi:hypothetical protein
MRIPTSPQRRDRGRDRALLALCAALAWNVAAAQEPTRVEQPAAAAEPKAGEAAPESAPLLEEPDGAPDDSPDYATVAYAEDPRPWWPEAFDPRFGAWYAPARPVSGLELWWTRFPGGWLANEHRSDRWTGGAPIQVGLVDEPGAASGIDLYFSAGVIGRYLFQSRELPTSSGITGAGGVAPFGNGDQEGARWSLAAVLELAARDRDTGASPWRLRVAPLYDYDALQADELGVVDVDPGAGKDRQDELATLAEASLELDLSGAASGDILRAEVGLIPFRSDFRGFLYDAAHPGLRVWSVADDAAWQWNAAVFDLLNYDTHAQLPDVDEDREQEVLVLNAYRRDWPWRGYTSGLSLHYSDDHRGFAFDDDGFLVTPAPIGALEESAVRAWYLGWCGEGGNGPWSIAHAAYQALGEVTHDPIAAGDVHIDARLFALEVERRLGSCALRAWALYASGDPDPRDARAEGFDGIQEHPLFAGGDLSVWGSQGVDLLGTNLKNSGSPYADLSTSKTEGHAAFVNPGLELVGAGVRGELAPGLMASAGANFIAFDRAAALEELLGVANVEDEVGFEVFAGLQWRPLGSRLLTGQVGVGTLFPGEGFEHVYGDHGPLTVATLNVVAAW